MPDYHKLISKVDWIVESGSKKNLRQLVAPWLNRFVCYRTRSIIETTKHPGPLLYCSSPPGARLCDQYYRPPNTCVFGQRDFSFQPLAEVSDVCIAFAIICASQSFPAPRDSEYTCRSGALRFRAITRSSSNSFRTLWSSGKSWIAPDLSHVHTGIRAT